MSLQSTAINLHPTVRILQFTVLCPQKGKVTERIKRLERVSKTHLSFQWIFLFEQNLLQLMKSIV
jgi:hypothetical protein